VARHLPEHALVQGQVVLSGAPEIPDAAVSAALRARLDAQRAAFARGAPDYERRMEALATLRAAVHGRQAELLRAVADDFGGRSDDETLMLELFPFYDQVRYARRHLKRWMRRRRVRSSWFLMPSRAWYQYQPLGVAGVIGAWNYQLLLTLGPVVDAIAAGNHVMLKPSEITPRSAEVIARAIADAFPAEYIDCVTGGPDIASAFAALPFDHLFFTGSGSVARLVMRAAAEHLTPVTLELGGKSPAIVHASYPVARAADRIMTGKLYNAGQTCVAPDHVILAGGSVAAFEAAARTAVARHYPALVANPDYTRIVSAPRYQRLQSLLHDARSRGARVVTLDPADEDPPAETRVFPPTLVFDATDDMRVLQEEIFGPILPVLHYGSLEDALARVNAQPRPLALYYFDEDPGRVRRVLEGTLSGGVTLNDCLYHLGQHGLPFGGVGPSGMGRYHGFHGFETFSTKRAVMQQPRWAPTALLAPPFGDRTRRRLRTMLRVALRR
jgi:coniferyl-aldehyde dehydrogenase